MRRAVLTHQSRAIDRKRDVQTLECDVMDQLVVTTLQKG